MTTSARFGVRRGTTPPPIVINTFHLTRGDKAPGLRRRGGSVPESLTPCASRHDLCVYTVEETERAREPSPRNNRSVRHDEVASTRRPGRRAGVGAFGRAGQLAQ